VSQKSTAKNILTPPLGGWGACPVDFIAINEHKARINAFFVLGLAVTYLLTGVWPILVFLTIDFLLRATELGKYSPIAFLSDAVIKQFKIGNKPVDRAPKRFAAWVGFSFLLTILTLLGLKLDLAATVMTVILCVFATLESFFGICAGCYVYSLGLLILKKKD